MASNKAEKLQNLRICIDNEESDSDNDELCLTDEPSVSVEDGEIDKRIPVAKTDKFQNQGSPVSDREHAPVADDHEVQFNVYLNKLDPIPFENAFIRPTRRYENREGNFVTGIDISKKEEIEKLQERAKRFGMEFKPELSVTLEELYKSLGLKAEDLSRKDERGIRLEAIHFRGVNEMNTKDIFNYFQEFAAGECEWIDDGSCNVVWQDKLTAARAMLKLSRSYEQVMEDFGLKPCSKNAQGADKRQVKCEDPKPENVKKATDVNVEGRTEERMEDDDELDLTEVKRIEESEVKGSASEIHKKPSESGEEDMEEGEINDDSEEEHISRDPEGFSKIPWPPGKWRLGVPYKDRVRYLFLRFATKADVKLPGAESRSKFYQKYGNPNYGGVRGLLSKSLKKKLHAHKDEDMVETSDMGGGGDARYITRDQISYGDDMFSDTIAPVEVEEIDMYVKPEKAIRKSKKISISENAESEHSTDENDYPVVEHAAVPDTQTKPEGGSDSDVDEAELERLLGGGDRKPVMRMYADEIEEKQKFQRHHQLLGALTIVSDVKKKMVKRVQDARQLITGVDLRSTLRDKIVNRPRSPVTWKRSMSPEIVPTRKEPMKLSPIHMTIENSPPVNESSSSAEEEEVKVEETVKEKQLKLPVEFKSKMDEAESHKDVRSRLSQRAPDTKADVRISSRRSPNNVKSRLSKRISPVTISPKHSREAISPNRFREREHRDTRISRVRKSRSPPNFRPNFRAYSPVSRHAPLRRSRSPGRRHFNDRYRSPYSRRLNRSRSRSPMNRRNVRSNIRSRSPVNSHINNRSRLGHDARLRLGRKSRSPTDTESDSDNEKDVAPVRTKKNVEAKSSSSSSSSSTDSSSDDSSSDSSSSSSSSSSSASSSSDSESDSDASERNAIRNKKSQRQVAELAKNSSAQLYEKQVKSQQRPQHRRNERIDYRRNKHKS